MSTPNRWLAFAAYLLSLPGAIVVLLIANRDPFARFHARQSLALWLAACLVPLVWAVVAWGLAWIPVAGGMLGVVLFALVLAIEAGLALGWLFGMRNALQGRVLLVPFVGQWAAPPALASAVPQESAHEIIDELAAPDPLLDPGVPADGVVER